MTKMLRTVLLLAGCSLVASACASTSPTGAPDAARAQRYEQRLAADPNDAEALRELGVYYMEQRNYPRANEYLRQAYEQAPGDPKTMYYAGLASETVGNKETALRLYELYVEAPRSSPYRRLLEGRYQLLVRDAARAEIQQLLVQERAAVNPADNVSNRIVAVFPLVYAGGNERYAPLGRGLSEMMMTDLGSVGSLQVVERIRLQALLQELELAKSQYMDQSTTPRVGRLLGAGQIVGGTYNVLGRDNIRVDVDAWEWTEESAPSPESQTDILRNLFALEKQIVFGLIEGMGIQLTAEERNRIDFVPTQNLQAFLAFSRGLEMEDVGDFRGAARSYNQAVRLDPNFTAAAERAEAAESASDMPATVDAAVIAAASAEFGGLPTVDVMGNRLGLLGGTLGAGYMPGPDARSAAQESPGFQPTTSPRIRCGN